MRIIRTSALTLIMLCCAVCFAVTSAYAITSKDLTGKTWIFIMQVWDDGTIIDTDTLNFNARWSKSELTAALKAVTVSLISYEKVSVYRLKLDPSGKTPDSLLTIYFDAAGYSLYGYQMPLKITNLDLE
jgi:hypothetical protein